VVVSSADAVVIGGGVVGCSIAYHLARDGADVVVVERETIGSQSTGKCAGGVRKQFSAQPNVLLQQLSVKLLAGLEAETGVDPEFRHIGYLFLLTSEADVEAFRRLVPMWQATGVDDARWLEPREVPDVAPLVRGSDILGATFCPSDGIASPHAVTQAYAGAARRLGVRLQEGVAVEGIELVDRKVQGVRTTDGTISTTTVFNCAGAWARGVGAMAGVDVPVEPYPRNIFVTGAMPEVSRRHPMTIDFATSFYFHPEGDGLLFGMGLPDEKPTFDTDVDWGVLDAMAEVIDRRAPLLATAGIQSAWAGLYEVTPDHQPILGPVDEIEGFWCACGFSGHGFQQAPAVGHLLAQSFRGEEPEVPLGIFAHRRFASGNVEPERNVV
jgi:sarcosine oxidase subunit beta